MRGVAWYWWPVAILVWAVIIVTAPLWVPLILIVGRRMRRNHEQLDWLVSL